MTSANTFDGLAENAHNLRMVQLVLGDTGACACSQVVRGVLQGVLLDGWSDSSG